MRKEATLPTLVLCFFAVVLVGCKGLDKDSIRTANMNLSDLLVKVEDVPAHWTTKGPGPGIDPSVSTDSTGITFYSDLYPKSTGISEDIYRLNNPRAAKNVFADQISFFTQDEVSSAWTFRSTTADESHFGCHRYPNMPFPICGWTARYDSVVVELSAWLVPERLTVQEMQSIAEKIDERAGSILLK